MRVAEDDGSLALALAADTGCSVSRGVGAAGALTVALAPGVGFSLTFALAADTSCSGVGAAGALTVALASGVGCCRARVRILSTRARICPTLISAFAIRRASPGAARDEGVVARDAE